MSTRWKLPIVCLAAVLGASCVHAQEPVEPCPVVQPADFNDIRTYEEYLAYLLERLQREPPLAKPLVFSRLRPVPNDDPYLDEMVRICRTVHLDVWTDGDDWKNAKRLCTMHGARVYLKVMPFQLTKPNEPDDRYDLSTPMNNGIWRQLNRLTGQMDKWVERDQWVEAADLHSELWPWPSDTNYGQGSKATKYANRLHRYRAATAIVRAYVPSAKVFWYYYANVQKHPGDVWYYDRSANHTNEAPELSDFINPEMYRCAIQPEFAYDYMPVAAGFESGVYTGEAKGKPMVPLFSILGAYGVRGTPYQPEWSRMKGWNWNTDVVRDAYPDGNDYGMGKFLLRPASCGDSFAWMEDRVLYLHLYGSPWYMNGHCQEVGWQCEFWRRFLIFCRGARSAPIEDLVKPPYQQWNENPPPVEDPPEDPPFSEEPKPEDPNVKT